MDLKVNNPIVIVHIQYTKMVLDYDIWHNQKLSYGILIEFWKKINLFI
jgi:hypothetical protein